MSAMEPLPYRLARRLERIRLLDGVIAVAADRIRRLPAPVRDVLHGVPAGHPIHPVAVLMPIGAWMSASVLDLLPGRNDRASRALVGVGVLAASPAMAAGLVDWSTMSREQQRVGAAHAAMNLVALGVYGWSWVQRVAAPSRGRLSSLLGLTLISTAGYLGGHLTYRQGGGVEAGHGAGPV